MRNRRGYDKVKTSETDDLRKSPKFSIDANDDDDGSDNDLEIELDDIGGIADEDDADAEKEAAEQWDAFSADKSSSAVSSQKSSGGDAKSGWNTPMAPLPPPPASSGPAKVQKPAISPPQKDSWAAFPSDSQPSPPQKPPQTTQSAEWNAFGPEGSTEGGSSEGSWDLVET